MNRIFAATMLCVFATAAAAGPAEDAAVARRVFSDIYNKRDFAAAAAIYAPDFVDHGLTRDAGLAEDQAAAQAWCAMFPDLHVDVVKEVAADDPVTVTWIAQAIRPSAVAEPLKLRGIAIRRVKDGKLAGEWSEFGERRALGD